MTDIEELDGLYEQFSRERDVYIGQIRPRPRPHHILLHNPLWQVRRDQEDADLLESRLSDFATTWWKRHGYMITCNPQDGSFTVTKVQ